MLLLISDVHFGKGSANEERAKEQDLLDLLDWCRPEISSLFLLGDVFDQYIEYRHLVPKGFVRFQAALSMLSQSGVPVRYLVGNHDPWHLDYFSQELGVSVLESHAFVLGGVPILLSHGDGRGRGKLAAAIHRVIRHRVSMLLYRTLLPADFGYRLAHFVKNRLDAGDTPLPEVVERLRSAAHAELGAPYGLVVLGHSHHAEIIEWPEGVYANTGSWHRERTVVSLSDFHGEQARTLPREDEPRPLRAGCRLRLGKWNGDGVSWYSEVNIRVDPTPRAEADYNTDGGRSFEAV